MRKEFYQEFQESAEVMVSLAREEDKYSIELYLDDGQCEAIIWLTSEVAKSLRDKLDRLL